MVAIDGLATVEGSGRIEQAMKAVAQECWHFLSMHGGRFSCMQALETKLLVPRVDAVRVLEWLGGIKRFPHAQQVAQILSHCVPVRVNGVGDLKAALQYSNHSSIDQYTGHFVAKGSGGCSARASFYFPSRDGFAYPWVASVSRWGGSLGYKGADYTRFNYGVFEPGGERGYQFRVGA